MYISSYLLPPKSVETEVAIYCVSLLYGFFGLAFLFSKSLQFMSDFSSLGFRMFETSVVKLQIGLDAENRSDSDAKDMTKIISDMQSNLMTRQLISDAVNKVKTIGLAGRLEFGLPGQSRLP